MYRLLQIDISEEALELLQAVLVATGCMGSEVRDHTLKLPPGTPPLVPGRVIVIAFYESDQEADDALQEVQRELPDAKITSSAVDQQDWSESWKQHVHGVRIGRVWVGPPWERELARDAQIAVVIEPGMAFGTGDHPTTTLCIAELEEAIRQQPGASVLDVGTGSGVLAIVARLLGAGTVVGNDIDPVAVRIARENAEKNGVSGIEFSDKPLERIRGQYNIVVANIFSSILCQLAPRLSAALTLGGHLFLSGILVPQVEEVTEAFLREGLVFRARRTLGEWALLWFELR